IGFPLPDTYFKIVKLDTHEEADIDEDGEICISGPTVMMGYLNNEKETNQVLRYHDDGKVWLHTGDIGSMDKEGTIIFKQRIKRMIISSGYNVYPSYIENVIISHKDVLACTVIGIPDKYRGQVAKAYIVLKDGVEETHELKNEIKELCQKNVSKYAIPKEYEYRKQLPKTLVGKVAFTKLEEENNGKK
ncbi:MAG: long-chain fatty acid--CoA ligase, partial [Firmicutes bacterium]|nr:long-chain fatty acid--CoA ligase [Bacillota bacterium]